jgi:lipopolysaccharide biosynthesis regulator YciM
MFMEIGGVVAALVLGYALGRMKSKFMWVRPKARLDEEGMAYIKGVNYILSDAPDLAIEEFIKAVKINSDTVETYLALGSLFRAKGDVTRAIRIHQGIIYRPNVDTKIVLQALYNLGLDYKKAGLLDRAIATFQEVIEKDPAMLEAHIQLEELYEEIKDWEAAFDAQEKISKLRKSEDHNILAHLMTEMGKSELEQGDKKAAQRSFKKAISIYPRCVDAYLHFGDLYADEGEDTRAVEMWKKVMEIEPSMTFLAYDRLEQAFFRMGKVQALEDFLLERSSRGDADIFTKIFLAKHFRKKGELEEAVRTLRGILFQWPNARKARQELIKALVAQGKKDEALREHERLLQSLTVIDRYFQCKICGYQNPHLLWKCPQCSRWDTMDPWEEEREDERKQGQSRW